MAEDGPSLRGRQAPARWRRVIAGDDLDGGDAGDIERVSRPSRIESLTQGLPASVDMAFDEGAGIEESNAHLTGARG